MEKRKQGHRRARSEYRYRLYIDYNVLNFVIEKKWTKKQWAEMLGLTPKYMNREFSGVLSDVLCGLADMGYIKLPPYIRCKRNTVKLKKK